ncbi:prolyl-tRNA synthetase associated domain-containing protein 1-like isoform X2 [Mangifera indica]|uniref:prolyl-tRNA synthetase associated domain-containing protein 1-like isoform X2 n=1 Tax=Mangifera indica TaxID=29780 RepID=UPI001CFAFA47|nr:prolyl-tRNA synthetase associated domain-containing protein 1-like isoform X2 [Mangifera indica]
MGYSKEQLLARLQDLQIEFSKYEHPVVMTVEAQEKYVGGMGGGCKNLFLKDKKHRYYIVSALAGTKVDMKVLSQRLGLGKGGLRMAPEEALPEILQVPLGSVTPFALVNESARDVGLLLDKGFKTQERCFFHPLSNDMSISLNANDLDKFLKSIGREPSYVDLEVILEPPEKSASSQNADGNNVITSSNSKAVAEKAVKLAKNVQNIKDKSANAVNPSSAFTDAEKFVEEILNKISAQIFLETKDGSIKEHGEELGTEIANRLRKCCCTEFKNLATIFKNTAYTQGFHAGRASLLR